MNRPILLSGTTPSGNLTIGNYCGALTNWIALQETHECYYMIADMHAITVEQEAKKLRERSYSFLAQYIAAGIDPNISTLFIQSHVPEHTSLAWILNCITGFGELSRMTQFKDKAQKHKKNINAGLFTYPVLMASDILLYQADNVPVGEDQKQHLELTRNLASSFNSKFGETFTIPEPFIPKTGARIMNLQDPLKKMDKSNPNASTYIALIDEPAVIKNKIKRAITDSEGTILYNDKRPGIKNLLVIYSSFANLTINEIETKYKGKGYAEFKKDLGEILIKKLSPMREKYLELMKNKKALNKIIKEGSKKASFKASKTLEKVYRKTGFIAKNLSQN